MVEQRWRLRRALWALALLPAPLFAQQPATVAGRVASDAGVPLGSASVFLEGMGLGTLTDAEGRYSFTVPAARATGQTATLTARLLGYRPRSAPVALRAGETVTQDFTLVTNPLNLGEVVITGAGTQTTTERLGTARSNVDSSAIVRSGEANLVNALAAKAPNVQVLSSSGEPGASSYIQVRGLTSIASGNGQPLFVVDGTPVDNTTTDTPFAGLNGGTVSSNRLIDLNPADIENIEILKGAAAGAIYGARAGQGVVLITTKKGRAGQTRYSLRSQSSFDDVSKLPDLQNTYGVGTGGATPACYTNPTLDCSVGFGAAGSWGPAVTGQKYNNAEDIFRAGSTFENTLSVSGGSERTTFYLSAGALNQKGIIIGPNNEFDRYSVRFNGSHQMFSSLRVGANVSYVSSNGEFVQSRNNVSGLLLGAWRTPINFNNAQYLTPEGQHRSYRYPNPSPASERVTRRYDNPFFMANEARATADVGRAFGNINADYFPVSWLRVNWTLGSDFSEDERLEALPLSASSGQIGGEGQVIRASIRNFIVDHNIAATANYTLTDQVRGTFTLGQNLGSTQVRQQAAQGNSLIAAEPFNLGNTNSQNPPFDFRSTVRSESYFGQLTVDLYDQLFLTGALRNDGFSTFGEKKRRAWFPKGSVSWSALRDPAITNNWVTFGKLRAAYGQSGTQPAPYQTQTIFSSANIFEGGWGPIISPQQGGRTGLYTSPTLGNPELGPERVRELELGADLGLYRDKADLSITHYRQKTTDAILLFPLDPASGFINQRRNVGSLENIGWEAALNLRPIRTQSFGWDVGLQWSRNRNKVLELSGAAQVVLNAPFGVGSFPQAVVREGQPLGIWLSDDFVRCGRGVIVDDENIDETVCQGQPNGALFIDETGYPIKDQQGQYLLADPNPDWMGAVRTNVTFRKLTVGGLVDIRQGGDVWNGTRTALNHFGRTAETARYREGTHIFGQDYLPNETVVGPGKDMPVVIGEGWFSGLGGVFNGPASFAFEDGSFVKLREISLAYLFDMPAIQRVGFSSLEVRLAGRNLHTWTDYSGVDPETSVGSAAFSVIRGVDYFNNPQSRSYVLTLTLNR